MRFLARFDSLRVAIHGEGFKVQCLRSRVDSSPSRKNLPKDMKSPGSGPKVQDSGFHTKTYSIEITCVP